MVASQRTAKEPSSAASQAAGVEARRPQTATPPSDEATTPQEEELSGESLDSLPRAKPKAHLYRRQAVAEAAQSSREPAPDAVDPALADALKNYRDPGASPPADGRSGDTASDPANGTKTTPNGSDSDTPAATAPSEGGNPDALDCLSPTWVDNNGIRHFKKHCL